MCEEKRMGGGFRGVFVFLHCVYVWIMYSVNSVHSTNDFLSFLLVESPPTPMPLFPTYVSVLLAVISFVLRE